MPGLIAGGQAAQEKGNLLLVSQSLAYRAIIATGKGDHRAASEMAAAIPLSPEGDQLSYNAGILAFAVAGLKAAEGDRQGAMTCCCGAGALTPRGTTASITAGSPPISCAWR